MNYEAFFVLSVLWLSIPPGKTREVNFTRVFFGKAREFSRAAMFVTSLLCRACYGLIFTSLLQLDINKLVPSCWQACYKLVANNLATALSQQPRYKSVNKLLQACLNKLGQAVRTHPVDKLLEQHCYKSAAGLLQLVRFYACTFKSCLKRGYSPFCACASFVYVFVFVFIYINYVKLSTANGI